MTLAMKIVSLRSEIPAELHPHADVILDVIANDTAAATAWPEGEDYIKAKSPAIIGRLLVKCFHTALERRPIGWLFKEDLTARGCVALAKASKVSGKLKYYAGVDFLIEINHTQWRELTVRQRIALLDHELCHCALDAETLAPIILPHDIEEFNAIVRRWGLWARDVEQFADTIRELQQGNLFDPPEDVASRITQALMDRAEAGEIDIGVDGATVTLTSGGRSVTLPRREGAPA